MPKTPKLPHNPPLVSAEGRQLFSLLDINSLDAAEKEHMYVGLLPPRLLQLLDIMPECGCNRHGERLVKILAPEGMNFARIEVRSHPEARRTVFFLDIAGTHYNQMELSFCIINDPSAPRFDVDLDEHGKDNCFATLGRNIHEEILAMRAGLFPNQTSRGLRMFGEFFQLFERFVDSLGIEMILGEPLTYDNAVRYERYGFDYLKGRLLMQEIDRQFRPGGLLFDRLDGSTPFRMPGMERTVHGRSWAIHDGILAETWESLSEDSPLLMPWEEVTIYRMIGNPAAVSTFTPFADSGKQ
ncbi:MAG TPA: hypothetical protein VFF53_11115 [Geobacteraceae bacterium]|nr:hypothetical protein [Geobacteraceae bacterium]